MARLTLDNDAEASWLEQLADVQVTRRREDSIEMQLPAHLNPNMIVEAALQHGVISRFELTEPKLSEILLLVVGMFAPCVYLACQRQN